MKKVFVSGCYDILHAEHVTFFEEAKKFGDYLIVSFSSARTFSVYKKRLPAVSDEYKKKIIESIRCVDEVVVGDDPEDFIFDFAAEFKRIRPDALVVPFDDKYIEKKRSFCKENNAELIILNKSRGSISTTDIINNVKREAVLPLRVDFAGAWLDVKKNNHMGGYVVNCTITPKVSLSNWVYNIGAGLGGSDAYKMLRGEYFDEYKVNDNVGWQDPNVIRETGLCVWDAKRCGALDIKINPAMLEGKLALYWTGKSHNTIDIVDIQRDYDMIIRASKVAREAICSQDIYKLFEAVKITYECQLKEGMDKLPEFDGCNIKAKKYLGSGWGGYGLYMFDSLEDRDRFLENENTLKIEPYIKNEY